jgi:beta-glucosidase
MTKNELKALCNKMTLEEKIGMVHGATFFQTKAVERLNIPAFSYSDGPMGVRPEYQETEWLLKGFSDDSASYLPSNTALASSFHPALAYEAGKILGAEARGRGKDMILAPGVNIHRSPLGGRNFEYMSEDPYLSARIAVPFIQGIQENDVSACVKHYALNNQETRRNDVDTYVSERALFEIYLPAFRAAVKEGHTLGLMGSYNKFRGTYCSHHPYLIDEILRGEWGFDGIMVSDWGSIHDTAEAGNTGIDVDMRVTTDFDEYYLANPLKKAVEDGIVPMEKLDEKIMHILNVMNQLHMLDGERKSGTYNAPAFGETLLKAAEESIILLKNEDHLLPLDRKKIKKLLVIGDNADRKHAFGGGSAEIKALYEISPLLGLKMLLGGNCEVVYEPGYYNYVIGNAWGKDANGQGTGGTSAQKPTPEKIEALNQKYLADAKVACQDADVVIFIGGLNHDYDVEGKDKDDMLLPNGQDAIIKELLAIRPDMIVTMITGSPVDMHQWLPDVKTLLTYSYNGMQGGLAFAKVLFGQVNPSGKLTMTLPLTLEDAPAHKLGEFPGSDSVHYHEDIYVGYRYFDSYHVQPAFAFGHGLSYTEFSFGALSAAVSEEGGCHDGYCTIESLSVKASLPVSNTGSMDGAVTVQFYIRPIDSPINRPYKELRGFDKQFLKAGETKDFVSEFDAYSFSYYDEERKCYVALPGDYEICAAFACDDIRSIAKVTIEKEYIADR